MAITQNTLIGRASGRVGNAVFSKWKNLNILKQKPESVANPRTELQVANRARFVATMALGRLLRPVIQLGFKEYSGQVSWLNRFMTVSTNIELMVWDEVENRWEPDFDRLVISEGSLYDEPILAGTSNGTQVEVSWDGEVTGNQAPDDRFFAVAIGESAHAFSLGTVERSAESCTIPLVTANGEEVWVVGFFLRNDGTIVSNSSNSSTITSVP